MNVTLERDLIYNVIGVQEESRRHEINRIFSSCNGCRLHKTSKCRAKWQQGMLLSFLLLSSRNYSSTSSIWCTAIEYGFAHFAITQIPFKKKLPECAKVLGKIWTRNEMSNIALQGFAEFVKCGWKDRLRRMWSSHLFHKLYTDAKTKLLYLI